ncbi:hypothetical protein ACCAA_130237 [Candidatus Accumulibacter aalborgensis]|uniref:Uncharacterized protein n=1 Tax=Candidatus Accumulibacter aalborgensis TaxID=1860102 RepID=A0A1A8XI35_9PROT|nr:hypothetical protein ACCAA_130237 [Candidatus Accumulibacter aalborgensis]
MTYGYSLVSGLPQEKPNGLGKTDQNDANVVMITHEIQRGWHGYLGTVVPAHAVDGDGNCHPLADKRKGRQLTRKGSCLPTPVESLGRTLDDLLAPIMARRADVMAQVNLARGRLDGQRLAAQETMGTMHATLGRGFLVLLHSHDKLLESNSSRPALKAGQNRKRRQYCLVVRRAG